MKKGNEIGTFFDRYDLFGVDLPKFNLERQHRIGTSVGCAFSLLLVLLIFCFTCVKFYFFSTAARPIISSYFIQNGRKIHDKVDLGDKDLSFKVAFSVEKITKNNEYTAIDDLDYVEWIVMFEELDP